MGFLSSLKTMFRRTRESPPGVSAKAAAGLREEGAVIVDVREAGERRRSRIPGSLHVPLGEIESRVDEIPKDRPVVFHCAYGLRAEKAAAIAREKGIDARALKGSLGDWEREGGPIEK